MTDRSDQPNARPDGGRDEGGTVTAAEGLLRALRARGVEYAFATTGSDHPPFLEAYARLAEAGAADALPELVACPHEFVAMSAAHGFAAATGRPQAVLVHVDVGTQNLGSAVHNAHRGGAPVFVVAGLAPVTDSGHAGSRDSFIHYVQDVFDQHGIVREYCRWTAEYRAPTDPGVVVARGLERARSDPPGPVYVTASREALETRVEATTGRDVVPSGPGGADRETVDALAEAVGAASAPLVVTSHLGRPPAAERVEALVRFAEASGAGVVEHAPTVLNFPRDHDQHVGYAPTARFDRADLVVVAASDVPWVPADGRPDCPVIQIDADPSKPAFPRWDYDRDRVVQADPAATFGALAERLDGAPDPWVEVHRAQRAAWAETLADHREAGRFTPAVLSNELDAIVDEDTVVVEDVVSSKAAMLRHLELDQPGSFLNKGGAGLGWAPGAGVGAKLADPERRVVVLVGDGGYLFSNPTAAAWLAADRGAPTLTVIYDNGGWNAVRESTLASHPRGAAASAGVPTSRFGTDLDLTAPAGAVEAHTGRAGDPAALAEELDAAVAAVEDGTQAVVDARIEPV